MPIEIPVPNTPFFEQEIELENKFYTFRFALNSALTTPRFYVSIYLGEELIHPPTKILPFSWLWMNAVSDKLPFGQIYVMEKIPDAGGPVLGNIGVSLNYTLYFYEVDELAELVS